ncbi:cytochrome B561 [Massilia sp. WF1]|uniref:cytochrome c oxidase subunit II n=1 Tax=unclassified Massilia TaxID=2609279 RepID=UPI00064A45C2|nr:MULTISPECIES: cytochrome c oxidase subunit II [unclassified Massilia]ALK96587.1 cytochrome B [Massilia sp. WG5]KLU36244.1 cytochrome B561 [Massilia sp. WF1]
MSVPFRLLPLDGAQSATRLDSLALCLLLLTGVVALGVLLLMIVFCVRYRAASTASREHPPAKGRLVEISWTVIPMLLFLVLYAWGAVDYVSLYRPDPAATPVFVVAKQWMWKAEHRNGRREVGQLHLPLGRPVRVVLTAQDVIHSFFVPAFRIKQDAVPGRYTSINFTPSRAGEYQLFCAEFCGTEHSTMTGKIVVMPPAEYAQWLAAGPRQPGMAARGFALFRSYGCSGCHAAGSSVHAPDLSNLLGRRVHLQDGRVLTADEAYVRDSILVPRKDIVAGYEPIMPSFAGQIGEEDLLAIIEYIRESGHDQPTERP